MIFSFHDVVILVLFGFFIGIIGSVMGIGGGAFIVPFLMMVFHLPIKNAIAVSLVSIIATSSAVASVNVERGLANIRIGILFEMTMALGSIIATYLMISINPKILQLLFAFMLLPTAISMYLKSRKKKDNEDFNKFCEGEVYSYYDHSLRKTVNYSVCRKKTALILSFFSGMLSGLFGLGGGLIQVPVMNIICKLPMKVATSTSNFMIGLSACASSLILWKKNYIVNDVAFFLIGGVIAGSIFGMKMLYRAKNSTLQLVFSALLMAVSFKMITGVFR
ncbi:MAG: sulfite exporter TauE/SafE family protein [Elusimicrobiales bacterium]